MAEVGGPHRERVPVGEYATLDYLTDEKHPGVRVRLAVDVADIVYRLGDDGMAGVESRIDKPYTACLSPTRLLGQPRAAANSRWSLNMGQMAKTQWLNVCNVLAVRSL